MTVTFWLLATAMTVAVLGLIFISLRHRNADPASRRARALAQAHASGVIDDEEYARKLESLSTSSSQGEVVTPAPPRPLGMVIALALALPVLAFALYRVLGTPEALTAPASASAMRADAEAGEAVDPHAGVEGENAPDMEKAVADLAKRLEKTPDDLQGWLLLARAYKATQRYGESFSAMQRALALSPDALEVQLEHAESEALAAPDRRFTDNGRRVLASALASDPTNQRALWLSGIDSVQREQYTDAISHWQALETQLDPGSDIAGSVREQISRARQVAGIEAPPGATDPAGAPGEIAANSSAVAPPAAPIGAAPAMAGANPVSVEIDISPELKSRMGDGDTLFVFARAAVGPKMPLAIQKRRASMLPLTLTLDDNMGMMPSMKMSSADTLVFGARISSRGDATPAPGDLQVVSAPIARESINGPVKLVINEIVR